VNAVKMNYDIKYVGTDLGFNVLIRPVMYDSHHDIEIYRKSDTSSAKNEQVRIVGNICETGDIIAKDRILPEILEEDIIGVLDAGAYGYAMSSNYNNRLRPAEVLIDKYGNHRLIRRREKLEDLLRTYDM
jgi:diaminopimelate decarboxylase